MPDELKSIIEALLFTSDRPLNAGEIHTWLPDETLSDVSNALKDIENEYNSMGRSFVLKEVALGYQFRTQSRYASYILRMLKTSPHPLISCSPGDSCDYLI